MRCCAFALLVLSASFCEASERADPSSPPAFPRNLILLIGDGMGPQQIGLLSQFARHSRSSDRPDGVPAIERVMNSGVVGLIRNDVYGALVADSAAAGTQLATGVSAASEMIGSDFRGNLAPNIVEISRDLGKSTGLITDARVTHATPASFVAHQPHRTMENEIAEDILNNRVDVLLGGGLRQWVPQAVNDKTSPTYAAVMQITGGAFPISSRRADNRNLLLEARRDYTLAFDRAGLDRVASGRILGLFADSEMDDALTERATEAAQSRTQPTLVEMTAKAIELLNQNEQGFFLMVEGAQIDWAGHNNDAGSLLHELLQFDDAVDVALQFAKQSGDTLVVVTADHETGSFGFSYSGRPLPAGRRIEGTLFRNATHQPSFNFAPPSVLDRIYAQKKSYYAIFNEFDALPAEQRTAERLQELVNANLSFKITLDDAVQILSRKPNPNYAKGHRYVGAKTSPRIRDFDAFYVYGENLRFNLLGRAIATQQHVVWGAGTHTSTPVALGAFGPGSDRFAGYYHSTEAGQRMIDLVREER